MVRPLKIRSGISDPKKLRADPLAVVQAELVQIGREPVEPSARKEIKDKWHVKGITARTSQIEAMFRVLFAKALAGDMRAMECILERVEGRVPIAIQVNPKDADLSDKELSEEIKRLEGAILAEADFIDVPDEDEQDDKEDGSGTVPSTPPCPAPSPEQPKEADETPEHKEA